MMYACDNDNTPSSISGPPQPSSSTESGNLHSLIKPRRSHADGLVRVYVILYASARGLPSRVEPVVRPSAVAAREREREIRRKTNINKKETAYSRADVCTLRRCVRVVNREERERRPVAKTRGFKYTHTQLVRFVYGLSRFSCESHTAHDRLETTTTNCYCLLSARNAFAYCCRNLPRASS